MIELGDDVFGIGGTLGVEELGDFSKIIFLSSVVMHAEFMTWRRFAESSSSSSFVQSSVYSVLSGQIIYFQPFPVLHHTQENQMFVLLL